MIIYHPEHQRPQANEFCIWLDEREYLFVVVNEIDYHWAVRWHWLPKPDKHGNKFYAYRKETIYQDGRRVGCVSRYLHVEIMKRTGIKPVSPAHKMVDHRSGCEFDCRRKNLRWATPSMNRRNIKGILAFDFEDLLQVDPDTSARLTASNRQGESPPNNQGAVGIHTGIPFV